MREPRRFSAPQLTVMAVIIAVVGGSVVGAVLAGSTPHSGWERPVVRAVAELAAIAAAGVCLVPLLGPPEAVAARSGKPAVTLFAVASAATLLWLWFDGADRAGVPALKVTLGEIFSGGVGDPGMKLRVVLLIGCALTILGLGWVDRGGAELPYPALAVIGVIAVVAPSLTGHMGQSSLGTVLIAGHAGAGTVWLGGLAAMLLLFRSTSEWAWGLPRFAAIALPTVAVLAATGIGAALVRLDQDDQLSLGALGGTGVGRLLLLKVIGLLAIIAVARWQREHLLPRAASRAEITTASLAIELTLAAAIIGVAATLAGTA